MSRLKLYDTSIPREQIIKEREERYLNLSPADKFRTLLHLIDVSIKLNGNRPLKAPQGKGIVISRPAS